MHIILGFTLWGKKVKAILENYANIDSNEIFFYEKTLSGEISGFQIIDDLPYEPDIKYAEANLYHASFQPYGRKQSQQMFRSYNFPIVNAGTILDNCFVGPGTQIMPGAFVYPDVVIGSGVLVFEKVVISPECIIENYQNVRWIT